MKPIIGDLVRESVVISTPALNRQILLDLKAVKQEQGLRVNLYPWCHVPTHKGFMDIIETTVSTE